jgi:hypothetical protein
LNREGAKDRKGRKEFLNVFAVLRVFAAQERSDIRARHRFLLLQPAAELGLRVLHTEGVGRTAAGVDACLHQHPLVRHLAAAVLREYR